MVFKPLLRPVLGNRETWALMSSFRRVAIPSQARRSVRAVPRLCAFYGIAIYLYWDDHNPPHYHAVYGEHEAWIVIADGAVLHGSLPKRALRLVRTWHQLHQVELDAAWEKAKANQPPGTIDPLP